MQELAPLPPLTDVPTEARATVSASVAMAPAASDAADFGLLIDRLGARNGAPGGIGQQFEASVLTPLVAAILPPEDSAIWGGQAGRNWRGLFAEQLAAATAQAGGFGIAPMIDAAIAARTASKTGGEG